MRKTRTIFIIAIIVSVFLLSFLIGRATALRDKAENHTMSQIYNGAVLLPHKVQEEINQASSTAEGVVDTQAEKKTKTTKKKEEQSDAPPERMLFPCGTNVLKDYSQTAVYSETMGDWRAHTGVDYEAEKDTDVISAWDGIVKRVYKDKLWGYTVEIEHSGNLKSVYKNLQSKIKIKEGDKVKKGQAIAKVGDSASIESREKPHLHFELWQDNIVINPTSYVY